MQETSPECPRARRQRGPAARPPHSLLIRRASASRGVGRRSTTLGRQRTGAPWPLRSTAAHPPQGRMRDRREGRPPSRLLASICSGGRRRRESGRGKWKSWGGALSSSLAADGGSTSDPGSPDRGGGERRVRGRNDLGFPPHPHRPAFCSGEMDGGPSDLAQTAGIETLARSRARRAKSEKAVGRSGVLRAASERHVLKRALGRKSNAVGWAARFQSQFFLYFCFSRSSLGVFLSFLGNFHLVFPMQKLSNEIIV